MQRAIGGNRKSSGQWSARLLIGLAGLAAVVMTQAAFAYLG